MLTVLLTRHGHTDRSEPERYLGQNVNARLTERGRADARKLAERLAAVRVRRIISSPLERALDTARILAGDRPLQTDARLAEMDYGTWEDLTVEQLERDHAGDYARYEADPSTFHIGGAESGEQVAARVRDLLDDLLDWAEAEAEAQSGKQSRPSEEHGTGPNCLLVGHASVNRVLLAVSLGVPLRDYRRRFEVDWASLTVLRWHDRGDGPRLLLGNDVSHLRGLHGVTWG